MNSEGLTMQNRKALHLIPIGATANRTSTAQSKGDREIDDPRRPVWLEATDSFYKKLNRIARECQLSRYDALSRGLDVLFRETEVRNSPLNRNIKSPGQSEVFRRTMGQVSRNYWATISPEEKRERGRKNAQARWKRHRDSQRLAAGDE
jgi:hypothetical protein